MGNKRDIKCPYCNEWQNIDHDDGYGFEEDTLYEQECHNCDKTFCYITERSYAYKAYKANCLNDENAAHVFVKHTSRGKEIETYIECWICGKKKESET